MIRKRMTLSIITLIGSLFLFVIASFAWFAISNQTNSNNVTLEGQNIDVSATLYDSDDDVTYNVNTSISMENSSPGDVKYFKLEVTNNNAFSISTIVFLYGYANSYADASGDQTNHNEGRELADVALLNASNSIDTTTIVDQTINSQLFNNRVITNDTVIIPAGQTCEFYFSFTVPTSVGNNYQNLLFSFTELYVSSSKVG